MINNTEQHGAKMQPTCDVLFVYTMPPVEILRCERSFAVHISLQLIKSLIMLSVTDPDISLGQIPDVNFTSDQSCY